MTTAQAPGHNNGPSIQDLDPNFQTKQVEDGIRWYDAGSLTIEGRGWPSESTPWTRLPHRAEAVVRPPVWQLSRHSAGIAIRFVTGAPSIVARWKPLNAGLAMEHMPATGVSGIDLYARNPEGHWLPVGLARATNEVGTTVTMAGGISDTQREYMAYLPLYNGVVDLEIGVPESCIINPAPVHPLRPICFYGTSIVQGGCASRAGMAYPAIMGRALNRPHFNLGFSGNGQAEPEMAQLLAELDPAVFVLDPLPNLQPEQVFPRMVPFVECLREARPETPIVLVENIQYQDGWIKEGREYRWQTSNQELARTFATLQEKGVKHLFYSEGIPLLGDDLEATVDGTHPTDLGFWRMAKHLLPTVGTVLDGYDSVIGRE